MRVMIQGTEMYLRTRCADVDEVVALFRPFVDDTTLFVSTLSRAPVGMESAFMILLANGVVALRGRGVVRKVWTTPENPYRLPGLLLAVRKLTRESEPIFARMREPAPVASPAPEAIDPDNRITRPFRIRFRNPATGVSS